MIILGISIHSSKLLESTGRIDGSIKRINKELEIAKSALKLIDMSQLKAIIEIVNESKGETVNVKDFLARIIRLESKINDLGDQRVGPRFIVRNSVEGGSEANCPPGTYISAMRATRGVSGRYAVDGISEIQVTCTPILVE